MIVLWMATYYNLVQMELLLEQPMLLVLLTVYGLLLQMVILVKVTGQGLM